MTTKSSDTFIAEHILAIFARVAPSVSGSVSASLIAPCDAPANAASWSCVKPRAFRARRSRDGISRISGGGLTGFERPLLVFFAMVTR